jgi:subtilisin family serine protease
MRRWLALLLVAWAAWHGAHAQTLLDAAATGVPRQVLVLLPMPPDHFRPDSAYAGAYGDAAGKQARRRLARSLAREHGLLLTADWAMPLLGLDCYVMDVPPERAPDAVALALSSDRRVAWAQPMALFRTQAAAPDPLFSVQPAAAQWHLAELHRLATGRGVRVAVIDSGVDGAHPDLQGRLALDASFVGGPGTDTHGTAVAGIIGARAGDGVGIAGVAPAAELLALRACRQAVDGTARCTSLALAQALHRAVDAGAHVVNMSLSGPPDRLLARLVDAAASRGITVVGAFDRTLADGGFPASHPAVLAVDDAGTATRVLVAPGRDVPVPQPGARWQLVSGASYAAAHVSGLQALLRELGGSAGGAALRRTSDGGVDACASVGQAARACACGCAVPALARQ